MTLTFAWPGGALPANALVALLAAAAWGAGDFAGGMGVKVSGGEPASSLRVICVAHAISLVVLLSLYRLSGGTLPHGRASLWALLAGIVAGLSISAFYLALARGAMGLSAAVSGLLAAAIPAAASSVLEGRPTVLELSGFALAGAAIWLIAAGPSGSSHGLTKHDPADNLPRAISSDQGTGWSVMTLSILGGLGFGVYFFLLRLANSLGVLAPVALARVGSLAACLVLLGVLSSSRRALRATGRTAISRTVGGFFGLSSQAVLWSLGVAVMDTAGNLLFVASTRMGRLDVASVLASLYPAGTILLAAFYLHERPTAKQLGGMALALAAVILVTI